MSTKVCNGPMCEGIARPLDEFYKIGGIRNNIRAICKKCIKEINRLNHLKNKSLRDSYKEPCIVCNEKDLRFIEFAHINREEKKVAVCKTMSRKQIEEEVKKCKSLCIWCHRLETKEENQKIKKIFKSSYSLDNEHKQDDCKRCNGPLCKGRLILKTNFYIRKDRNTLHGQCKDCMAFNTACKIEDRENFVNEIKLQVGKCKFCKVKVISETTCCFDYDHITENFEKYATISRLVQRKSSRITILQEIKKCRLLCCKCHKLRTLDQLGYNERHTEVVYYEERKQSTGKTNKYVDCDKEVVQCEERRQNARKTNKSVDCDREIIIHKEKKQKKWKTGKCIDCNSEIDRKATRCVKCYLVTRQKVPRPSLDVLLIDIANLGYCGTGRKYGVTDNSIRKWVKALSKT